MTLPTVAARSVPVFDKALSNGFKESQENIIRLPEENPAVVEAFLMLVCEAYFAGKAKLRRSYDVFRMGDCGKSTQFLFQVYILAEKLGGEAQQNRVTDLIRLRFEASSMLLRLDWFKILDDAGLLHDNDPMTKLILKQLAFDLRVPPLYWNDAGTWSADVVTWLETTGGYAIKELIRLLAQKECKDNHGRTERSTHPDDDTIWGRCERIEMGEQCEFHVHTIDHCTEYTDHQLVRLSDCTMCKSPCFNGPDHVS